MSKKSFLAETLAEIESIKKSVKENANYALKSTLKDDLEAIVKNGLNEAEEDIDTDDMGVEMDAPDTLGMDNDTEEMEPTSDEPMDDVDGLDVDGDVDVDGEEEFETIDLTDKEDDEVINHFNLMNPADEIEIVRTDDGITINIGTKSGEGTEGGVDLGPETEMEPESELNFNDDDELEIDLGDEETGEESELDLELGDEEEEEDDDQLNEEDTDEHEEPVLGNKTGMSGKNSAGHDHEVHESTEELQESLINTRKKLSTLVVENKRKDDELKKVVKLVEGFKKSEDQYKSAIKTLKTQLEEVALFTSNLTYAIKLMTENSTTKEEKLDILKRFDSAKTLTESREVFKSLESAFTTKKPASKIVEEKVLDTNKTSGASQINESTAYKNPQLSRMLDIINKIK